MVINEHKPCLFYGLEISLAYAGVVWVVSYKFRFFTRDFKDDLRKIDSKSKKIGAKRFKSQRNFVHLQHDTIKYPPHNVAFSFFSFQALY